MRSGCDELMRVTSQINFAILLGLQVQPDIPPATGDRTKRPSWLHYERRGAFTSRPTFKNRPPVAQRSLNPAIHISAQERRQTVVDRAVQSRLCLEQRESKHALIGWRQQQ